MNVKSKKNCFLVLLAGGGELITAAVYVLWSKINGQAKSGFGPVSYSNLMRAIKINITCLSNKEVAQTVLGLGFLFSQTFSGFEGGENGWFFKGCLNMIDTLHPARNSSDLSSVLNLCRPPAPLQEWPQWIRRKKKKRKICIPFLSIRLSPSPFWLLSTSYDFINHHLLGNRWRPATDPGQVEESKLQISSLGCFKRTLTFGNQIISSSTTAAPQPSRIWWAEVGSDKVQKLHYCIQVDFSCICTLLEYSFFWQFSIFAVQWRTQNDWGAGSFLKK